MRGRQNKLLTVTAAAANIPDTRILAPYDIRLVLFCEPNEWAGIFNGVIMSF